MNYLNKKSVEDIDIRGKRQPAKVVGYHIRQDAAPYVRPILPGVKPEAAAPSQDSYAEKVQSLLTAAKQNHIWRRYAR